MADSIYTGPVVFGLFCIVYYILFGFSFHYLIKCQYSSSGPNPKQRSKDDILGEITFIPASASEIERSKNEMSSEIVATEKRWPMLPFILLPILVTLLFVDSLVIFVGFIISNANSVSLIVNPIRYYVDAVIYPAEMITVFELIYLVHKKRSTNFCGLKFDVGARQEKAQLKSLLVRWGVWLLSFAAGGFYIAAALVQIQQNADGTTNLILYSTTSLDFTGTMSLNFVLKIIPWFMLSISTIYISLIAWRYGTSYAFQVHATFWNPWLVLVFGSFSLCIGSVIPGPTVALYTSKAGALIFTTSIVRILPEIVKELQVNSEAVETLDEINQTRTSTLYVDQRYTSPTVSIELQNAKKSTVNKHY